MYKSSIPDEATSARKYALAAVALAAHAHEEKYLRSILHGAIRKYTDAGGDESNQILAFKNALAKLERKCTSNARACVTAEGEKKMGAANTALTAEDQRPLILIKTLRKSLQIQIEAAAGRGSEDERRWPGYP